MTDSSDLPQFPSYDITPLTQVTTGGWFTYPVTAHPHYTDYEGSVWHGSYIVWLEEARIECLQSIGVSFADLVEMGCGLPVVELAIRYHLPIRMGTKVLVRTRMVDITGVRINWDYQIQSVDGQELYATARVTLVAVDSEKGKIMRQLPPGVKDALLKLAEP
ncbi:MAG: thioesterase family protein [Leptolyngbyaceae cyanobacterium bins.349]|nr:thioesterase family protein [Leptolyngbyaceae cyanobacterium bins.349]